MSTARQAFSHRRTTTFHRRQMTLRQTNQADVNVETPYSGLWLEEVQMCPYE